MSRAGYHQGPSSRTVVVKCVDCPAEFERNVRATSQTRCEECRRVVATKKNTERCLRWRRGTK